MTQKENENIQVVVSDNDFGFQVLQYKRDMSVLPSEATSKYFASKMDCHEKFVLVSLNGKHEWTLSAGAMNWFGGNVECTTGVKGVGDFFGKAFKASVTKESIIKPVYKGVGVLATEPTYKHIIPQYLNDWGGKITVNDGFYYMSTGAKLDVQMVKSVSGAVLGGEGLFNLALSGDGVVLLESVRPLSELITVDITDDVFKIDGNMAVCWSSSLAFTVERVTKTLTGSAASGEGLVNVFRGTGRILMSPFKEKEPSALMQLMEQ